MRHSSKWMAQFLTLITYWITLAAFIVIVIFVSSYIISNGICKYRKQRREVIEETFELDSDFQLQKLSPATTSPVHSPKPSVGLEQNTSEC